MSKGRVFVVQRAAYKSARGEWMEKYDISSAATFGEVVDILPPGNVSIDLTPTVAACEHALWDFSDDDYLLALGDPVAIAAAAIVAARRNKGRVSLLKWDRRGSRYRAYDIVTK